MLNKSASVGTEFHQSPAHLDCLLSNEEAAYYIGVKKETLDAWRCNGRYPIPHIKVGRLVKYRKSDLDHWLDTRRTGERVEADHV